MVETRRVHFHASWFEDVDVGREFEVGGRVTLGPGIEQVVTSVSGAAGRPLGLWGVPGQTEEVWMTNPDPEDLAEPETAETPGKWTTTTCSKC